MPWRWCWLRCLSLFVAVGAPCSRRAQTKEFLPAHALRRILALQTELIKTSHAHAHAHAHPTPAIDRAAIANPSLIPARTTSVSAQQRALLSANFGMNGSAGGGAYAGAGAAGKGGGGGANAFGRSVLSAGDRLRDLIVPDALESLVTAPAGWIPGIGLGAGNGGAGAKRDAGEKDAEKAERVRRELEDVLAAACPLCESVVAGLDRPFVMPGEVDASWDL